MPEEIQDLVIIGGGIMGLCTAYYASQFSNNIVILEKATIGPENQQAASFSLTRSIRNDYLDPLYAQLAYEARRLWLELQHRATESFLIECGCLNIARADVTPDLDATYAEQSYRVLNNLHLRTEAFTRDTLRQRFPQFEADLGRLDVEAGFLYVPEITRTLLAALRENGVRIHERVEVGQIRQQYGRLHVDSSAGALTTRKLVIVAGLGTNALLQQIEGCSMQFPLRPDRPRQCKYFIPPPAKRARFTPDVLPVFAYLDAGIYGHPLYEGKTPGVKIGFYYPPDAQVVSTHIQDVQSFVDTCMPELRDAQAVDVQDVDQCFYDLVADDNFILGNLPGFADVYVGVGWRGTGYKYAPWVGQTLAHLALQASTPHDISRFTPQRFGAS
ncbi:MAG TPA: FAD-dependent oxidoreductase [Ktedonobacteraceae bacterium]|nr:FAD-dependent oxidoreductase [Ktedonobacteraceae bacterium]